MNKTIWSWDRCFRSALRIGAMSMVLSCVFYYGLWTKIHPASAELAMSVWGRLIYWLPENGSRVWVFPIVGLLTYTYTLAWGRTKFNDFEIGKTEITLNLWLIFLVSFIWITAGTYILQYSYPIPPNKGDDSIGVSLIIGAFLSAGITSVLLIFLRFLPFWKKFFKKFGSWLSAGELA